METITRYVITRQSNADTVRESIMPMEGRYTFSTVQDAEEEIKGILEDSNAQEVAQWFPNLEVRPVQCDTVLGEPIRVTRYFGR